MYCYSCGAPNPDNADICCNCGKNLSQVIQTTGYVTNTSVPVQNQPPPQVVYPQPAYYVAPPKAPSNGIGTAGLVLAILCVCLCWIPVVNIVLCVLGLVLSFVGVFIRPRGIAIAGLCVAFAGIAAVIVFMGSCLSMFGVPFADYFSISRGAVDVML